jgi:hypothetical protein
MNSWPESVDTWWLKPTLCLLYAVCLDPTLFPAFSPFRPLGYFQTKCAAQMGLKLGVQIAFSILFKLFLQLKWFCIDVKITVNLSIAWMER